MKYFWYCLFIFLCQAPVHSQDLMEIDLPSREVYDLLTDRRGFLWIGHDLGISRYDGSSLIHFSHPQQAALSMTDLVEDSLGRIWCHNFSGQVFYVEKEQMKLLQGYDYKKENRYPRIALFGDELLVTSRFGLFVCNTNTLKGRYLKLPGKVDTEIISLALAGNEVFLHGTGNTWFGYQKEKGLYPLKADTSILASPGNNYSLQPSGYKDTVFFISNPAGILQKLVNKGGLLLAAETIRFHDFINTVTVSGGDVWVHTRNQSVSQSGQTIPYSSLTDIVKDQEGNTWYSSLKNGLQVRFQQVAWSRVTLPLEADDYVRCVNTSDGYFFTGTQQGSILVFSMTGDSLRWQTRLPEGTGPVEFIRYYKNHLFVTGTATNTYLVNTEAQTIKELPQIKTIKDVDFNEETIYLASAIGSFIMPNPNLSGAIANWVPQQQKLQPGFKGTPDTGLPLLYYNQRSRAIRYHKATRNLFICGKNGLYVSNEKGMHPFLIEGRPVFGSSLAATAQKLFIGTFNDGLWIYDGKELKHLTENEVLSGNTILKLKITGNHLWIFQSNGLQVLDVNHETMLYDIDLPRLKGSNIFDVAEFRGSAYITTLEGIYQVPLGSSYKELPPRGYLNYVLANKDTLRKNAMLSYDKNDIQFFFSAPVFYDPAGTVFRYRLSGADDTWQTTRPGEFKLRYASLNPGDYVFEAYAVRRSGLAQETPLVFGFTIQKPWWKQWWFYLLLLGFGFLVFYAIAEYRVRQKLSVEVLRRSISSDLHDDIGATLSSINIYAELAREERDNASYLGAIQHYSKEVISKLDDLVWSVNPKNDSFSGLWGRMEGYARPLMQAKNIHFELEFDPALLKEKLDLRIRHLYLVFKELVNNAARHSGARNCRVMMECRHNVLYLEVRDDGAGFDVATAGMDRNGLENIRERVQKMRGRLQIDSGPGEGACIRLSIPLK